MTLTLDRQSAFPLPEASSAPHAVRNGIRARGPRSECSACGEVFAGVQPFDRHRVGPHGYCATHDPAHSLADRRALYSNCPKHQTGCSSRAHPDRRCLTRTEIEASMTKDARGYWRC